MRASVIPIKHLPTKMSQTAHWPEVESEVYRPGAWLASAAGALFLVIGLFGVSTVGKIVPPGVPVLIASAGAAFFAFVGGVAVVSSLRAIFLPRRVRHAAPDVLPDIPNEPVSLEGSIVCGRLTHEIIETSECWQYCPARSNWRNNRALLFGFGIPCSIVFVGLMSWALHDQHVASWPVSILMATATTLLCGGSAFSMIFLMMRSSFRKLSCLTIPCRPGDLELETPRELDPNKKDLVNGLNWMFGGDVEKKRLTFPPEQVIAVQLCPWKFTTGSVRTWAVQGLLVIAGSEAAPYLRLPILLTNDMPGAARLMQQLAAILHVPYLFGGNVAGWRLEERLASHRPPLKVGGTST